ncbi:unnamed protein product [Diamesa serratosioi]
MVKFSGSFQNPTKWDPILLVSQIVAIQSLMYISLGFLVFFSTLLVDEVNLSLSTIFHYQNINVNNTEGKLNIFIYLVNSLFGSLFLWYIVKRTKLCLDFCCTFHIIHIVICWCYDSKFPNTLSYWMLNLVSGILMTVSGEYLCLKTELKDIPVVGYSSLSTRSDL